MNVVVQLDSASGEVADATYRWDADTEILIASLDGVAPAGGMSGSVELAGSDGSWLVFDVAGGRIRAIEVAVWPEVRPRPGLAAPTKVEDASVVLPARASQPGIASLAVDTPLMAEADEARRVIHFRLGAARDLRTIRLATNLLLEVDSRRQIAGVWFLGVPPIPST